jgi:hypothetical protein
MISLIKRGVTKVTPLLFLLSFKALSQPNLVPNPSMEVLPPDTCLPGNLIDIQQQFPTALTAQQIILIDVDLIFHWVIHGLLQVLTNGAIKNQEQEMAMLDSKLIGVFKAMLDIVA